MADYFRISLFVIAAANFISGLIELGSDHTGAMLHMIGAIIAYVGVGIITAIVEKGEE